MQTHFGTLLRATLLAIVACGEPDPSAEHAGDGDIEVDPSPTDAGQTQQPDGGTGSIQEPPSTECAVLDAIYSGGRLRGTVDPNGTSCFYFTLDRVAVLHVDENAVSYWVNAEVSQRESGVTTSSSKVMESYRAANGNGVLVPLPAGDYVLTLSGYGSPAFDLSVHAIALSDSEAEWKHDDPGSTYETALELTPGTRVVGYVGAADVRDTYAFTLDDLSHVTIVVDDVTGYARWQVSDEARNEVGFWTNRGLWEADLGPGRFYLEIDTGAATYAASLVVEGIP
jgi:hypothetical protein